MYAVYLLKDIALHSGYLIIVKQTGVRVLSKYNEEVMEHMADTAKLMFKPILLKYYLLLVLPTFIVYKIGSGALFIAKAQ